MRLEPLLIFRNSITDVQEIGDGPFGIRRTYIVGAGTFEGERLRALGRELRVPCAVRKVIALSCATCALSCSLSLARAVLPTPMREQAMELLQSADQPGCLQLRYAVFGALAEAATTASQDLRETSR